MKKRITYALETLDEHGEEISLPVLMEVTGGLVCLSWKRMGAIPVPEETPSEYLKVWTWADKGKTLYVLKDDVEEALMDAQDAYGAFEPFRSYWEDWVKEEVYD